MRGTLLVADSIRIRIAVQVKRWKQNVQAPIVQQVRSNLGALEQGLIITTGGYSTGAIEEAARVDGRPVALIDGKQLASLLAKHGIGAHTTAHNLLTLDEDSTPVG